MLSCVLSLELAAEANQIHEFPLGRGALCTMEGRTQQLFGSIYRVHCSNATTTKIKISGRFYQHRVPKRGGMRDPTASKAILGNFDVIHSTSTWTRRKNSITVKLGEAASKVPIFVGMACRGQSAAARINLTWRWITSHDKRCAFHKTQP